MPILKLFGFKNKDNNDNKNNKNADTSDIITETSATVDLGEIDAVINGNEDEEELIAVITAAVSAVLKKSVSGFRVVSFKKRGNWKNIIWH